MPSCARRDVRSAQTLAFLVAIGVVLVASRTTQGVYSDPALQLHMLQRWLAHEAPRFNTAVVVDWTDVSRDVVRWEMWWPPSSELLAWPLLRIGLSIGSALRVLAALSLVVGSVGWATWFGRFNMPRPLLFALAAAWPCVRYASNAVFLYSSEILVFAAVPWVLVRSDALLRRLDGSRVPFLTAAGFGGLLGLLYWIKYSALFVSAGVLIALAWRAAHVETDRRHAMTTVLVVFAGACLPVALLTIANRILGGASTIVTAAAAPRVSWRPLMYAVAFPPLVAADGDGMWRYLLMHPSHPVTREAGWLAAIGLPGGLLLLWLFSRRSHQTAASDLALGVFVASICSLVAIWLASSSASYEARHLAPAAAAALPLAVAEGRALWDGRRWLRVAIASAFALYVCIPLAYGAVSVVQKARRFPRGYRTGASGIYNPQLSTTDVGAVRDALQEPSPQAGVWYFVEPISMLDLPGRAIDSGAELRSIDDLRGDRFLSTRELGVRALLPARFEQNGKGAVVRAAFPQAHGWSHSPIAGSEYLLWTTVLEPRRP